MPRLTDLQKKVHRQLGWADAGFKASTWVAYRFHTVDSREIAHLPDQLLSEVTLDPASTELTESELQEIMGDHNLLVNPVWFARWRGIAISVTDAVTRQSRGESPDQLQVMGSMNYQSPRLVKSLQELMTSSGLMDEAIRRQMKLPNMPRRLTNPRGQANLARDQRSHLVTLMAAVLDPKLDLDQATVDAFMKPIKEPSGRTQHQLYSWMMESYAATMSAFISHCIDKFGSVPSAKSVEAAGGWVQSRLDQHLNQNPDNTSSGMGFLASYRKYGKSPLARTVLNAPTLEALDTMLAQIKPTSDDLSIASVVYGTITGVPAEWVTGDIASAIVNSSSDELDWSEVKQRGFQTDTLMKRFQVQS